MSALTGRTASAVVMTMGIALAGCADAPHRPVDEGYGQRDGRCHSCGVVQDVRQVDTDGGGAAWHIAVRLDNGQYATVTQRESPAIRDGDYVEVRGGAVYAR
jgi:outer membrane lipoprotein SlyB